MRYFPTIVFSLFLGTFFVQAQYTSTINSNRPGESQGAFAVGTQVLQIEAGGYYGQDNHELNFKETTNFGADYAVRYGLLFEELELSWMGSFLYTEITEPIGTSQSTYTASNFESNTFGAKYLIYDPYKRQEEPNIRSWKANQRFKLKTLIPAVSAYAGVNVMLGDNPFKQGNESSFTPKFAVITQNNWGPWVFVMNFIADKITEEFPTYTGIFTMTHSIRPRLAVFGEYQIINNDFYSDNIARAGGAYLFSENLQVDVSGLFNFKDTPERWQVAAGVSYRWDLHSNDVYIEDERARKKREKEQEKMDRLMNLEE